MVHKEHLIFAKLSKLTMKLVEKVCRFLFFVC